MSKDTPHRLATRADILPQHHWRWPLLVSLLVATVAVTPSLRLFAVANVANVALLKAVSLPDSHASALETALPTVRALFQQVLALDSTNARAYAGLGRVHSALHDYEPAVDAFERSIQLDPRHARTYFDLANTLDAAGKTDQAIGAWARAGAAQHFIRQGDRQLEDGQPELAEAEYRRAALIAPRDPQAYHTLGDMYWYPGKLAEAVSWYKQALSVDPNISARVLLSRGNVAAFERRWDDAIASYQAGVSRLRNSGDAYGLELLYGLANVYHHGKRQYGPARSYYMQLQQRAPRNVQFHVLVGQTYLDEGQPDAAAAWYLRAQVMDQQSEHPFVGLGMTRLAVTDLTGAESYFVQALERNPNSAEGHARLGTVRLRQGRAAEAEEELLQAIATGSDIREYVRMVGDLYRDQGRWADALQQYDRAASLDENDSYSKMEASSIRNRLVGTAATR